MFVTENLKEASAVFAQHRDAIRSALHEYREAVCSMTLVMLPTLQGRRLQKRGRRLVVRSPKLTK